jgi:hypothetical protein
LPAFLRAGRPGDLLAIVTFDTYGALAVIDRHRQQFGTNGFSAGPDAAPGH